MKFINFIVVEKLKIYKLCRCTVTILDEARIFHFKYGAKYICQGEGKGITIGRKNAQLVLFTKSMDLYV